MGAVGQAVSNVNSMINTIKSDKTITKEELTSLKQTIQENAQNLSKEELTEFAKQIDGLDTKYGNENQLNINAKTEFSPDSKFKFNFSANTTEQVTKQVETPPKNTVPTNTQPKKTTPNTTPTNTPVKNNNTNNTNTQNKTTTPKNTNPVVTPKNTEPVNTPPKKETVVPETKIETKNQNIEGGLEIVDPPKPKEEPKPDPKPEQKDLNVKYEKPETVSPKKVKLPTLEFGRYQNKSNWGSTDCPGVVKPLKTFAGAVSGVVRSVGEVHVGHKTITVGEKKADRINEKNRKETDKNNIETFKNAKKEEYNLESTGIDVKDVEAPKMHSKEYKKEYGKTYDVADMKKDDKKVGK